MMTDFYQDSLYYVLEITNVRILMHKDLRHLWNDQSFETKTYREEIDFTDVSPNVTLETTYIL